MDVFQRIQDEADGLARDMPIDHELTDDSGILDFPGGLEVSIGQSIKWCQEIADWTADLLESAELTSALHKSINSTISMVQPGQRARGHYDELIQLLVQGHKCLQEAVPPGKHLLESRFCLPVELDIKRLSERRLDPINLWPLHLFHNPVHGSESDFCDHVPNWFSFSPKVDPFANYLLSELSAERHCLEAALKKHLPGSPEWHTPNGAIASILAPSTGVPTPWQEHFNALHDILLNRANAKASRWIWLAINLLAFGEPPYYGAFDIDRRQQEELRTKAARLLTAPRQWSFYYLIQEVLELIAKDPGLALESRGPAAGIKAVADALPAAGVAPVGDHAGTQQIQLEAARLALDCPYDKAGWGYAGPLGEDADPDIEAFLANSVLVDSDAVWCPNVAAWVQRLLDSEDYGALVRAQINWSIRAIAPGGSVRQHYDNLVGLMRKGWEVRQQICSRKPLQGRDVSRDLKDMGNPFSLWQAGLFGDEIAEPKSDAVKGASDPFVAHLLGQLSVVRDHVERGVQFTPMPLDKKECLPFLNPDDTPAGEGTEWQKHYWKLEDCLLNSPEALEATSWVWLGVNLLAYCVPRRYDVFEHVGRKRQQDLAELILPIDLAFVVRLQSALTVIAGEAAFAQVRAERLKEEVEPFADLIGEEEHYSGDDDNRKDPAANAMRTEPQKGDTDKITTKKDQENEGVPVSLCVNIKDVRVFVVVGGHRTEVEAFRYGTLRWKLFCVQLVGRSFSTQDVLICITQRDKDDPGETLEDGQRHDQKGCRARQQVRVRKFLSSVRNAIRKAGSLPKTFDPFPHDKKTNTYQLAVALEIKQ